MRSSRVTVMSMVLVATLAAAAAAAPSWSPAKKLAPVTLFDLPTNTASIAVAPSGDAVAVWVNQTNGAIQYAQRRAGAWTAAKAVYTPSVTKNETAGDPQVVLEPGGTAITVFWSTTPGPLQYCVVGGRVVRCYGPSKSFAKAATLPPGATTWTKVNVSTEGIDVNSTRLGVDQSGNAVATWSFRQSAATSPVLQSAVRPAGGSWTPPTTVYTPIASVSLPTLAVGPSGDAVLAWQERALVVGSPVAIRAIARTAGTWSGAAQVATPSGMIWTLRAATDASGQSAVVWDDAYAVWSVRGVQGSWGPAAALSSGAGRVYGWGSPYMAFTPDVAADGAGDFLIAWAEMEAATGLWTIEADWQAALGPADHVAWSVDPQVGSAMPRVTASPDGTLGVVAWNDNGAASAYAGSYLPGSGWAQPIALGVALWDSQIAVGSGPASAASAVWVTNTAVEFKYTVVGSSYQP